MKVDSEVIPTSCQVYTPQPLAHAMVRALGDMAGARWLDPCTGSGVFLSAINAIGVEPKRVVALDVDSTVHLEDHLAQTQRGIDFLQWSEANESRFDRIVANPPFIGISKLPSQFQERAARTTDLWGHQLTRGANYWYAFLCASLRQLGRGGSICFVLPAAWDYADYAAPLRDGLGSQFHRFEIHRCRQPLFPDVRDGCIVLIGHGYGLPGGHELRFEYDSPEDLVESLTGKPQEPDLVTHHLGGVASSRRDHCLFGDILDLHLGGVTGDSKYFLLTEEQRLEHGLPIGALRPVVSRARHLATADISPERWESLRSLGERIWLFHPPTRLLRHTAVKRYLELEVSAGGCKRGAYKVARRKPWYLTPLPPQPDGFISGMSRTGPWLALRTMPRLTATNTLYTARFKARLTPDEQASWAISIVLAVRSANGDRGRRYPDGLIKYEPGDLMHLELVRPHKFVGATGHYRNIVRLLVEGQDAEAKVLAEDWIMGRSPPLATESHPPFSTVFARSRIDRCVAD